ncbi:MAG: transporter substrate-binding domain-containing protein [Oscillospiraceae bacterium]|nr:transporter substrate-binding domain-containing protein [Oscillospiraceae bacterium]
MKKATAIVLAVLLALFALAGCQSGGGEAEAAASNKLEEIVASGTLVVGTDPAWAPFEYIGADGEITGADYEIASDIAEALGVELEMKNIAFDSLIPAMQSGEIDMILAAMTITDERLESVDFSEPYTQIQQCIIVAEDSEVQYIDDLAGGAVGAHLGTTGDFLVSDEIESGVLAGTGASINQYKYLTDACLAILSGDLQAVVCDAPLAENLCTVNEGLKFFPVVWADGTETEIESFGIAMPKGETELVEKVNEIISPLIADGTIDAYIVDHSEKASNLD